jgi:hypothetical protein
VTDFCSRDPIRIGHLKDLPPDSYGAGFHALRRPGRAARRDRMGIWALKATQRFRALGIRLRLKRKG